MKPFRLTPGNMQLPQPVALSLDILCNIELNSLERTLAQSLARQEVYGRQVRIDSIRADKDGTRIQFTEIKPSTVRTNGKPKNHPSLTQVSAVIQSYYN